MFRTDLPPAFQALDVTAIIWQPGAAFDLLRG